MEERAHWVRATEAQEHCSSSEEPPWSFHSSTINGELTVINGELTVINAELGWTLRGHTSGGVLG